MYGSRLIESEKKLERKLSKEIIRIGGICLKIPAIHYMGIPDRLCLLPGGRLFFAEIKTTGKKPEKIQLSVHKRLKNLGFRVEVIDNTEFLNKLIFEYEK